MTTLISETDNDPVKSLVNEILKRDELLKALGSRLEVLEAYWQKRKNLSYVEDEEEIEARQLIIEQLGFDPGRVTGPNLLVLLHIPDIAQSANSKLKKEKSLIQLPESFIKEAKWNSPVGCVVSMGPLAYSHPDFGGVAYCKVGDWVRFSRGDAAIQMIYDKPFYVVPDRRIQLVVSDPDALTIS